MLRKILTNLILGVVTVAAADAQTTIPGGNVSGTWTLSGSPYIVTGEVSVPSGQDLTIEPGVEVLFNGNIALFVYGTFHAVGTETDSIIFTRTQPTGPGWEGIRFWEANSGSEIAYSIIEWGNSSGGTYPDNYGGGVFIRSTNNVVIRNSTFHHNVASFGGAIYTAVSNVEIHHNVFENNMAGAFGSALSSLGGGAHVWNNTFINNEGQVIHLELSSTTMELENNILYNQSVYFENSGEAVVRYNDLYSTSLIGIKPIGLGTISTVNANGDPADQYMNVFLDPMLVDPTNGDYHLMPGSPAIDAGNPDTPINPDGTVADLGAFYFHQSGGPVASISLTPDNPPIVIPASGGSFDYNIAVTNNEAVTLSFDIWVMLQLPGGSWYGPVLGPADLTLSGGVSIDRDRTQNIPDRAASGTYTYEGRIGVYPDEIWHSDRFTFEKSTGDDGITVDNWFNTGESFNASIPEISADVPAEFVLRGAYPNPFNPTTTIGFALPEGANVSLTVYDLKGRQVVTLANGWREAGSHEVSFNASGLAAGIYLYRLTAGGFAAADKIVLMK